MSRLHYLLDADFAIPLDLGVQAFLEDKHARRAIMAMAQEALTRWKPSHGHFDLAAQAAALTIQAAFAEREARLVELLDRAAAIIPEHTYINWHCALAALKDRTHG